MMTRDSERDLRKVTAGVSGLCPMPQLFSLYILKCNVFLYYRIKFY